MRKLLLAVLFSLLGCSAPAEPEPPPERVATATVPLTNEEVTARLTAVDAPVFPGETPWTLPTSGFARIVWPDGQRAAEGWTRDGRRHGRWARWYRDGRPLEEGSYENDVPVGVWRAWGLDGSELESTDYGTGADCEFPIPLPYALPRICSGRVNPGVAHLWPFRHLRRCVGHAESAIRSTMQDPDPRQWSGYFGNTQSVEVGAIVGEITREALDDLRDRRYEVRAPDDAAFFRQVETGMETLLALDDLVMGERALEDVAHASEGGFIVFSRTIERARRERPGFVQRWYLALEEAAPSDPEPQWPFGASLEAELRASIDQILTDDAELGEALLRRTIARHEPDAATTHLATLHTTLAHILARRGARDEASAELDRTAAIYAAQGCTACSANLAARRPAILKGAPL